MSFLDRLFPRGMPTMLQPARVVTGIKAYSETPGVMWERTTSSAGVAVDEYEALTLSAVFSACNRLAGLQAMLPIGVYEEGEKGRLERRQNPVSNLLNVEMNKEQTAFTGRFFMQFWKPLFGAACAEIGWDGASRAVMAWPLGPWRVQVKYDQDDELYYLVDGKRRVHPDDMIYIPHVTQDGVTGEGFVHYAIESLGQAIAADRASARFFENDMRPGGLLKHPGTPSDPARKRFRQEWADNHGGVKNRGKVGVLWGGWEWVKDSGMIDPDKAQLLESRQYSVLEVARWLNVPVHWLGDLSRATWSNIESQSIETLTQVLQPLLVNTEQEFNRKMLAPPRLYCKHNVNALLRGDMKSRSEFYRLMVEIGAYTQNMVLGYEDENGIGSEGDRRFIPVNWQPLDDLMTGGEAQAAASAAKQPVATKPTSPASPASSPPAVKKAASAKVSRLLEHVLSVRLRVEDLEVSRASKKPNSFMAWMDGFYPEFEMSLTTSLLSLAATIEESDPATWSSEWVAASRTQLLAAMDGPPEEWPNRVIALMRSWQNRPTECALLWTKPLLEKEIADVH